MEKQTFIQEMSCNFNLREPKAHKPTNIYFVVCIEGKQIKFSTGVKVYPEQWNKKKQEAFISFRLSELDNHNNSIVNTKITAMKKDFMDYKDYLCANPNKLDSKILLLKQYIYKDYMKKESNISATAIMKQIIVDKNDKESSKLQHMANLNKFERFLKENNIENSFNNMNLKTFNSYQNHLQSNNKTPNTIKNIIKGTLFPILKKADKNLEIPFKWDNSNLDSFELIKDQSNKEMADNKKVALTEEQVTEIHKFSINKEALKGIYQRQVTNDQVEKFQEVKDMFVLQCFVGQRISDIQKFFNGDNFMDIENNTISIKQKKGGARAIIPILPIAQELLEKYKGKTLKYYKERNSWVNTNLKNLLRLIGFNDEIIYEENGKTITKPLYELVHTHTARHTFVTMMCRKNIPKETVILATGHEDTKMIDEVYSHLNHKDKSRKVAAAFNKAFNPDKVEASTENINADRILELIDKGIAEKSNSKSRKKVSMLEYCIAANTILSLIGLQQQGIDIYQLPELSKAIAIIKNIQRLEVVKEQFIEKFKESEDKETILQNIDQVDKFIWNIGKRKADPELYQMLQHKLLTLGLSDEPIMSADDLDYIWQMEIHEEEMTNK